MHLSTETVIKISSTDISVQHAIVSLFYVCARIASVVLKSEWYMRF